ncbi:WD domain, G-beta repeat protein [Dictyocaulus viviparus]|uniref:WD domain, G-beta repeat protein n=1 Tax=Dictyocaulus viviparus TaxID=29172 RepID=A0A0D8XYD6_DICVI|nr:WD domain, G-beta repeat protein [Dictyocaulus viviparus]
MLTFKFFNTLYSESGACSTSQEIKQLREELAEVYKQKSRNDQSLIDANQRLDKCDSIISTITKERDKLVLENKKLYARVSELECNLKKATDDRQSLYDEWIALSALLETKTNELLQLQQDRLVLINKIRDLNEQHANLFNTELDLQQERQQRKIREEIARACEDTSKDDKVNISMLQSNIPTGEAIFGDIIPQEIVFKAEANDGEVYDVLWLSGDTFASGGSDKRVRLWKVDQRGRPSKTNTLVGCNNSVTRLDFNMESRLLLGASNDHGVRLWNVDNQRLMTSFMGHMDKVSTARFLTSTQVVSGSNDRVIKFWDIRSERCVRSVFPGSTILDIAGTRKGTATFTSGHFDKKLRFWDSRNHEPIHTTEMAGKVTSLDMSSDGIHLLCSTRDDTLSIIDVRKYQTVHIYSAEQYRTSSDLSRCVLSAGMEYCAAGSSDGHVFVWNIQSTKLERILHKGGHEHAILSLSWNPSGRGLLSADKQKLVCLWK